MTTNILDALQFNRVHCGDVGARTYFGLAADEIVKLQRERDHFRRMLAVERVASRKIKVEADALEAALTVAIMYTEDRHP